MVISKEKLVEIASNTVFNKPLVTNVYRSVIVEAIISTVLVEWDWCSSDYSSYDFRHPDGTRLEVKQSALKQSWNHNAPSRPSWDIKPRTGCWENGTTWIKGIGRNAEIYVFGLHSLINEIADHRIAEQWRFFVIPTSNLPDTQRISEKRLRELAKPVDVFELSHAVADVHKLVSSPVCCAVQT